ncbi:MAG: hypothetical protein AAGG07_13205 [Planctomycetota bacterium]
MSTTRHGLRTAGALASAVPLLLAAGGCGLEAAIIGASVSAAQTGVTLVEKRKIHAFELAMFDDVEVAARVAGERMSLRLLNEKSEDERVWLYYRFRDTGKVTIEIHRLSDTVTWLEIAVGSTEQRGMASLFLRQVIDELEESDSYLDDWDGVSPNGRPGGGGID